MLNDSNHDSNRSMLQDGFSANADSKKSSLRIIVLTEKCLRLVKLQANRLFGKAEVFFKVYKLKGKNHVKVADNGMYTRDKQSPPKIKPLGPTG